MSLILDAGALIAVEREDRGVAALIEVARLDNREVFVPAGVIGQVWRGGRRQARVARLLNARGVLVEPLTDTGARVVGVLCGATETADLVDASVVLAAHRHRATVLSSHRADLEAIDPKLPIVDC